MTDNQLRERAEAKYPLHNDPASDPQQYLLQQAYISAYKEAIEEMSKGWVPIGEYKQQNGKRNKVIRWHKIWKSPICVSLGVDEYKGHWLESTLSNVWPEESFEPFFAMPLPAPPSINEGEK